jgi:hypothetical protein
LTENGPDSDEDEPSKLARPPYSSDVNLASRAQMLEEGRVHRIGHRVRTELYNPSRPTSSSSQQANLSGTMDEYNLPPHMLALRNYFYRYTGAELKEMSEGAGWYVNFIFSFPPLPPFMLFYLCSFLSLFADFFCLIIGTMSSTVLLRMRKS